MTAPKTPEEIQAALLQLRTQAADTHGNTAIAVITAKIRALEWVLGITGSFGEEDL